MIKKLTIESLNYKNVKECVKGWTHKELVILSVFSSELVIHLYDGNSKAPRKAIQAAKNWLENPTLDTDYAASVACAASDASDAASASLDVSDASAYAASAAYAACAAAYASLAASTASASIDKVAIADEVKQKIADYINSKNNELSAKALNDQAIEDFYDPDFEKVEWKNGDNTMTTYNTYAEAKIANKYKDIYELDGMFQAVDNAPTSHFANGWILCNPADHCMGLEAFFDAGHKLVVGDSYINYDGDVYIVGEEYNIEYSNTRTEVDSECFVLSAKALNDQAIEDFYDPDFEKVEWKNGEGEIPPIGCIVQIRYNFDSKSVTHTGLVLYASMRHCILSINGNECHFNIGDYVYEKPETPEQKKEREEKEAFIKKAREIISGTKETNAAIEKMFEAGMRFK